MMGPLILLLLPGLVGALSLVMFSPGQTVTLICAEETNITEKWTLIVWRKENVSHYLYYVSDGDRNESNFTDPRISFLSAQRPPVLQIRDARPDDAGNYTCQIAVHTLGLITKSWTLQISERPTDRYEMIRWILSVGFFTVSSSAIIFATKYKPK